MPSKLHYYHSYVFDIDHEYLEQLKERGFYSDPDRVVDHGEGQICRFVMLDGAKVPGTERPHYLEFVHLASEAGSQKKPDYYPRMGLCMTISDGKLKELFQERSQVWQKYEAEYKHKNYNFKEVDDGNQPGWNFVDFKKQPIDGLRLFLVTYDPYPKKRKPSQSNENGINLIKNYCMPGRTLEKFANFMRESDLEWDQSFFSSTKNSEKFEVHLAANEYLGASVIEAPQENQWNLKFV